METTTTITMNNLNDDITSTTRQSSKLSLGSSPSVLSADEQLDGDGPLTPTDKIEDDEEDDDDEEETPNNMEEDEEDDDDDDLSALNSILQAGSPGSLSNEEVSDEDDLHTEQDSASPLSSVPDDFPLSRSASPELLPMVEELPTTTTTTNDETPVQQQEEEEEEEEEEEVVIEKKKQPTTRKRRKEATTTITKTNGMDIDTSDSGPSPTKKSKQEKIPQQPAPMEEPKNHGSSGEENINKKRRASRSITNVIMPERPRRRQSRQDEQFKKEVQEPEPEKLVEEDEVIEDKSNDNDEDEQEEEEEKISTEDNKSTENNKEVSFDELNRVDKEQDDEEEETQPSEQQNGESEDQRVNNEPQENDDHDYQQRHKEALDALTHIEVEFARLRDKMYEEKMSELNEEAIMIANGTHPELVTLMAEIEEKKGKRINSAEAWRKHQHANFRQQFEGFEYQANIHFISQKNALRRDLLSSINGKRWNIEDERTKLNDPARTDRVFPDGREMVAHKREQKEETGELQDIKDAVGFPMAPNPTGLSLQDVDEDLKILGINNNNNRNL